MTGSVVTEKNLTLTNARTENTAFLANTQIHKPFTTFVTTHDGFDSFGIYFRFAVILSKQDVCVCVSVGLNRDYLT